MYGDVKLHACFSIGVCVFDQVLMYMFHPDDTEAPVEEEVRDKHTYNIHISDT